MKKTIIIIIALMISGSVYAQFDYNIQPDSMQNVEKTASYYMEKAGTNLKWAGGLQLLGLGSATAGIFVEQENQMVFLISAGIATISSYIAFIFSGNNLKKAAAAMKENEQKKLSLQGTENGFGLVFRF